MKKESIDDLANALLAQKDQTDNLQQVAGLVDDGLTALDLINSENLSDLDILTDQVEGLLQKNGLNLDMIDDMDETVESREIVNLSFEEKEAIKEQVSTFARIETLNTGNDWEEYRSNVHQYASTNGLDLSKDPFDQLLTPQQRADIQKRIDEEFKLKKPECDKYDYIIAAACGAVGGLIDAFFVKAPGEGKLGEFTDKQVDKSVQKFANKMGWKGPKGDADPTKSATGFLERNFRVNYDHRHTADVDGAFSMSTGNHHLKSLAHSPDIIGLFFSILGQFTDTAYFVADGKIIDIDTGTMELKGGNLIAKIFSGFINWLGHLMSDVAGSSGAMGRGSGIPIPFYELTQFLNIGNVGKDKKTIAEIAVKVFEQGYDFRHGLAMAIPVLITELSIRVIYAFKSHFYTKKSVKESILSSLRGAEIRRMLLIGHGTLCLIDLGDAAIRSGGEPINMLLHMNIIGWVRFGHLGLQEVMRIMKCQYDIEAMNSALDDELKQLISA